MKTMTAKLIASALVVSFLVLPAGLSAKERRGANLIVTRLDGSQLSGELIAVKRDSLLLLNNVGRGGSVDIADIKTVRIVRKSRAGLLSGIGVGVGFIGGAAVAFAMADDENYDNKGQLAFLFGLFTGGIGALSGLIVGSVAGVDSSFTVAGEPEADLADYWDKLRAYSREGRLPGAQPGSKRKPEPARQAGIVGPGAPPSAATPSSRRRPRFRLNLSGSSQSSKGLSFGEDSSFRFPEEVSPESGPYPFGLSGSCYLGHRSITWGPVSLAYEWNEHWSAEIEYFSFGHEAISVHGPMSFISSVDGQAYSGSYYDDYQASLASVLIGLTYRPFAPTALRRHVVEAGVAVGPGFVRGGPSMGQPSSLPVVRKVALCGRVRAAYDFYLIPAVSVGAFVGYRFLDTELPGLVSSRTETFLTGDIYYPDSIERLTEIALPTFPVKGSGAFWGLRIGFRI